MAELHPRPVNLGKHVRVLMVCAFMWVHSEPDVKMGLQVLDTGGVGQLQHRLPERNINTMEWVV